MAPAFPRLQAAAIDGRFENIYHRQVQLEKLCKALIDNVNKIKQAIAADSGDSPTEVAVQYHQTLSAVKRHYATLDPAPALEEEYLVTKGKNEPNRRVPAGIVYIEPTVHTLFYSTIVPLSAALAAGNVVVVLLENKLRTLPGLLRSLLSEALDADAFAVASKPVNDNELPESAIRVLQSGIQGTPKANQLTCVSGAPVVAVVDRTADLKLAARELTVARTSFGGVSPYAPDVVLVNEFVKSEFLQAIVSESVGLDNKAEAKAQTVGSGDVAHVIDQLRKSNSNLRLVSQETNFAVVEVGSRSAVLNTKINSAVLVIHTIKSLDDAIDLASAQRQSPSLAAYHFSNPATGKYLSQFISSEVSFINHIPREILLGPPAPSGKSLDVAERYPLNLFSWARPVFISPQTQSHHIATALAARGSDLAQRLLSEAVAPLKEFKRHPGGGVGFFEQGFLYSAGLILVSTLTVSATGVYYLWRYARSL